MNQAAVVVMMFASCAFFTSQAVLHHAWHRHRCAIVMWCCIPLTALVGAVGIVIL